MSRTSPVLVVAGLSVRALAQAARRDGFEVIALDLFGDADTRAACRHWLPLTRAAGTAPGVWQIDPASLRAAWSQACRWAGSTGLGTPVGLLAGSGLAREGADLVDLPLLGTAPADIAALRDPARFFGALRALGIEHPNVSLRPVHAPGWLRKDFGASGGAHIVAADAVSARAVSADTATSPGLYWQQRLLGEAMSLTLLGCASDTAEDGGHAALLGLNRLLTHAAGPDGGAYGHAGLIGPLAWTAGQQAQLQTLADRLVRRFRLRGLIGIDLLLVAGRWQVLEVNPRPTASLVLYGEAGMPEGATDGTTHGTNDATIDTGGPGTGLIRAHLQACRDGAPPAALALTALRGGTHARLRGSELVRSPHDGWLDEAAVRRLQAHAATLGLHDLPASAQPLVAGAPVCSVQVIAASAQADVALVRRLLERRVAAAQALLVEAAPAQNQTGTRTEPPAATPSTPATHHEMPA